MSLFNPMLAAEAVLGKVAYPVIGLPKLNGVRGCNQGGQLLARSLKPIPNLYTRALFGHPAMAGIEGELVVGNLADEEVFTISTSGVMTIAGTPDVVWHTFDIYHPTLPFHQRLEGLYEAVSDLRNEALHLRVVPVESRELNSDEELVAYSTWALSAGYEGLVLRDPYAKYKEGRSTAMEGGFMRFCPWLRSEAIILEIEEGKKNLNVSVVNELGYLKKSSHKDNKVGSGQAGSVRVRDLKTHIESNMPVPTDALQKHMWANQHLYLGKIVKYKHKPPVNTGGKPRFSQWEGLRSPLDM